MKVGDKVKVDGIGGFYSTYKEWAEIVGAERWVNNKYPKSMEFTIKAMAPHLTESVVLYLLSNDEGEFIFDNIHSNIATVKRTRTEYEKVTESIFDLRDEFECGELYRLRKDDIDGYVKVTDLKVLVEEIKGCGIFRLVEKEIDWRCEVHAKLQSYYHWSTPIAEVINDESDCFLELCRVALRVNGEIE
ncbi:hypothetical protein ValSw33_28 [Vibrio phage ValSw3-3]|nr:hypothetical protein ValSw33_28 [Vibrio phage ValSw3-3]